MKRLFLIATAILLLAGCNRYDDSAIKAELENLKGRVAYLEGLCDRMNTNLTTFGTILDDIQKGKMVTGMTPIKQGDAVIGYTLSFSDDSSITLYNGKDGATPVIGVAEADGRYWWTVDGSWLLDAAGNRIPASGTDGEAGITPQLRIEDGWWFVSTDKGASWTRLGKATGEDGDSFFTSVTQDDGGVYLVLADGTTITIPKDRPLQLIFDGTSLLAPDGAGAIPFRITGAYDDLQLIAFSSDSLKVGISVNGVEKATPADTLQAALDIQILGGAFGGGIMVAATSKDKSAVRIIDIERRLVLLDKEHFEIGRDGGVIPFTLFRNMPVEIGTDADWMRVDPVTRVIEETFAVTVEENATGEDRTGIILINSGADGPQATLTVKQWGQDVLEVSSVSNRLDFVAGSTATVEMTCSGSWMVEVEDTTNFAVSPASGGSGSHTLTFTARTPNEGSSTRRGIFNIRSGSLSKRVVVWQYAAFNITGKTVSVTASGGTVRVNCTFNRPTPDDVGCEEAEGFDILYDNVKPSVFGGSSSFKPGKPTVTCTGIGTQCNLSVDYILPPNYTGKERSGNMRFVCTADGQTICSEWFTLTQSSGGYSSDYSQDGAVTRMQTHSKGAGVPFVLMGDGFRDTDIASGKYDQALSDAFNYCFDIPPYNGLKEYFDVYKVTAVSPSANFDGSTTSFDCAFGDGTLISGDDDLAKRYASRATPSYAANNTVIFIVLNSDRYAGTAYLYTSGAIQDIPEGLSIAYIPMTNPSNNAFNAGFREVLHHEALGHGFGKLADEYYSTKALDASGRNKLTTWQGYGFYKNVSMYPSPAQTTWAAFAADERYASEHISCYEGGFSYSSGVYRPTQISIMYHNTGGFNAPSREAIYKRVMYLANGRSWTYDYETFVEFDQACAAMAPTAEPAPARHTVFPEADFIPLAEPRIIVVDPAEGR